MEAKDPDKNTDPSPLQELPTNLTVPDLTDIPEDDSAEPDDASVDHHASEEEVKGDK